MDSGHLSALLRRGGTDLAVPVELFADIDVPDPYYGEDAGFDEVLDPNRERRPTFGSTASRSNPVG